MSVLFFDDEIDGTTEVRTMPQGGVAYIQTDEDLTIAWYDRRTKAFGPTQDIEAPGEEVSCPSNHCRLVSLAAAQVRITPGR